MFSMYPAPAMPPVVTLTKAWRVVMAGRMRKRTKFSKALVPTLPASQAAVTPLGRQNTSGVIPEVFQEKWTWWSMRPGSTRQPEQSTTSFTSAGSMWPFSGGGTIRQPETEHVRLPVQAPGGVDHTAAPQPEVIFLCRFHDFHALTLLSGPRSQGRCPEYLEKALAGPSPGLFFLRPIQTG